MAFSSPVDILERFGVHEGQVLADLGVGSGFYTLAAAKLVGSGGRIYAVEIQNEVLTRLTNHGHRERITNIISIHADAEQVGGTKIADMSVDSVLVCNVLFQIEQKPAFVSEIRRILKSGGRVLVVDWAGSFGGTGPQPRYVVSASNAEQFFKAAGFTKITTIPAGDHHWGLVFRK